MSFTVTRFNSSKYLINIFLGWIQMNNKIMLVIFLYALLASNCTYSFAIYNNISKEAIGLLVSCDPKNNGEYCLLDYVLKPNNIIFDVGSNIGDYTRYVLSLNRDLKIYSFEPVFDVYQKMIKNLDKSICQNVLTYNIGFYKQNIDMPIWYAYQNDGLSSIYDRDLNILYKKEDVNLRSMDDFCLENHIDFIDFLKIDTEGAEFDVLVGANQLLSNKQIRYIQFEYGGTYLDAGFTLKQVFEPWLFCL